ncbi:hypothetical protein LTR47_003035 [Exophiala xenobiotica]|nr:hypothetical protein LTR47_003035 [Exophiala xenobiotica]KAK5252917.1 hypothetical protein LTS06_002629 [Exophiala xenobiotica]KAK5327398.1 hypothetical protein LTR93_002782 [Exophiala xenobiotica]KAK5353794.1 hypothetical protein LTR61_002488 [Exophiala xenobiotica]KAK5370603.1 hypothetical protein LTR11_006814 [Exophiala xenobiotica]
MGATCPQNAVVDVEEPEDRNLEDTGREQIFGDHGKFVEDEPTPHHEDLALESHKRTRAADDSQASSDKESFTPEFEQDYLRYDTLKEAERRLEGSDGDLESVDGEEPDLEDGPLVGDEDGKTIENSDDTGNERDDESQDDDEDCLSAGLDVECSEPESKYSIEGDEDYVDDGASLSSDEVESQKSTKQKSATLYKSSRCRSEKSQGGEDQNASCQRQSRAPLDHRGIDRPRLRRPVSATPQPTSISDEPASEVDEADENTSQTVSIPEDVETMELDLENLQCLHANDESTTAPKVAKVSEKVKVVLGKLGQLLDKYCHPEEPTNDVFKTIQGRRGVQKHWTDSVQLRVGCPYDVNEFWAQYWSLLRAASGVDQDDVGPNLTLSAEILQLQDKYVPGMAGLIPRPAQLSGAAFAKEQESGVIRSADGKHQYQTMPTLGGIVCDLPGGGKTLMSIMHHQNIINRMPPGGGVYMPSMYIVPKIAISQWYDCFRNNAPDITDFVIWGKSNFRKTGLDGGGCLNERPRERSRKCP